DRFAFEQQVRDDSRLAAELAHLQSLADLARHMPLQEPTDREIRKFWARFYNRSEWTVGWVLLLAGLLVLLGEGLYWLATTRELTWYVKAAVLSTVAGGALLVWNTLRLKLRASRFDRYRGVLR